MGFRLVSAGAAAIREWLLGFGLVLVRNPAYRSGLEMKSLSGVGQAGPSKWAKLLHFQQSAALAAEFQYKLWSAAVCRLPQALLGTPML